MERSDPTAPISSDPGRDASRPPADAASEGGQALAAAVQKARLDGLYQLAYGLSHEINNPLANIAARAQSLLADESDPQRRRALATIVQQAFRAHEMIADLMLVARPPAPRPSWIDLETVARRVCEQFHPRAQEQGTRLALRCAERLPAVWLDETHLGLLLSALVQNALEALRQGGSVSVAVERIAAPGRGERVRLVVADDGPGIPDQHMPHLFDPFFSGRESGRGLGLGLCKVWRIAQLYGGTVEVQSGSGQGTRVIVDLPPHAPPATGPGVASSG